MNVTRIVLAGATLLALAACGGTGTGSTTSSPPTATASVAATPAASATAVATVDAGTAGQVCAALNALVFAGHTGADAIATTATAYNLTQAQVVWAIDHSCPQLKQIVPPGQ